jgi:TetR/AcrR family transcriptional repressor of nem operon
MAEVDHAERRATLKAERNRQTLIDAAMSLFGDRGYHETSIGAVADAAGLAKGNVSYYFPTKVDLLEYVTSERTRQLLERFDRGSDRRRTPREALHHFLDVTVASAPELARVGCAVGTLCSELGKDDKSLQPYASMVLEAVREWLHARFAEFVDEPQATEHAEHLLALMQGAAVLAHASQDPAVVMRIAAIARNWLDHLTVH